MSRPATYHSLPLYELEMNLFDFIEWLVERSEGRKSSPHTWRKNETGLPRPTGYVWSWECVNCGVYICTPLDRPPRRREFITDLRKDQWDCGVNVARQIHET